MPESLRGVVLKWAHEAGFELAGVAPVGPFSEHARFEDWIDAGGAGEMNYMAARDEKNQLKRGSLERVAPWARSVIVCALNYNTAEPYSTATGDGSRGWISRYAWSREDYHDAVMRRLRQVEAKVQESDRLSARRSQPEGRAALGRTADGGRPHRNLITRCYVDTGPIVERTYAKYAGVGWIGKNTCILNQRMGSWLFLGVILTSLEIQPDLPAPDRCGTCTRCLTACPTNAFVGPYELDATRCISYLTIEKRGSIPEDLREGMGRHVFGCDICQDVCPWNRKAPGTSAAEFEAREGLVNPALEWLGGMDAEEFRRVFRGSPVRRAKLNGLRRNAAIAMGNSGDRKFVPILEKMANDPDETVSEAAKWGGGKLRDGE